MMIPVGKSQKGSDKNFEIIVKELGMLSILRESCGGDLDKAHDLALKALKESTNIYEFSLIDQSINLEKKETFVAYLKENMDDDITDEQFESMKTWLECATLKLILKNIGTIMNSATPIKKY